MTNPKYCEPRSEVAVVGTVTSPKVRLSPNARKRVREMRGTGAFTVTMNEHDTDVEAASIAVH